MNCKSTEKKLIFFIENSLKPEETVVVAAHLEQCPDCRAKLEYLKEILAQAEIEKIIENKPFLFTRIQGRLANEETHKTKRILRPLAIAVALVIGVFSGILLGQYTMTPNTTDQEREVAYLFQDQEIENMESLLLEDDF
jgi:predicted anti-sigma-YlaC factor YlaD